MKLVQFVLPENVTRLGILINNEVHDITPMLPEGKENFIYLLEKAVEQNISVSEFLRNIVNPVDLKSLDTYLYDELYIPPNSNKPYLTVPFSPPEVWCAGVTYMRSREAREFETVAKSIYDRVYDAERPEIFLKATSQRIVGTNDWVGLRSDSNWIVPEPELGLVIDAAGNIVGYLIGNDMSSRDIEGENPLYLPQAKFFKNACSLGPILALAEEISNPLDLNISCKIIRNDETVFEQTANTSQLKRSLEELVSFLKRDNHLWHGTVLLTGTCIVPPDDFTLVDNDVIEIAIDNLGILCNVAKKIS